MIYKSIKLTPIWNYRKRLKLNQVSWKKEIMNARLINKVDSRKNGKENQRNQKFILWKDQQGLYKL